MNASNLISDTYKDANKTGMEFTKVFWDSW